MRIWVQGALMMVLMWFATLWPEHNPFLDEHLILCTCLCTFLSLNLPPYGLANGGSHSNLCKMEVLA